VTEGDVIRYAITKYEPLAAEHEAFRELVLGRPHTIATLGDGLSAVLVAHAAATAAATGEKVAVPKPVAETRASAAYAAAR
jgi:predicted dehydrogenase